MWLALRLRTIGGPDAIMQLGVRDVENKDYDAAIGEFELAEQLYRDKQSSTAPSVVSAMARRAWCLARLNRLDEAIALYQKALDAKEARGDMKEPTPQKLRDYIRNVQERKRDDSSN